MSGQVRSVRPDGREHWQRVGDAAASAGGVERRRRSPERVEVGHLAEQQLHGTESHDPHTHALHRTQAPGAARQGGVVSAAATWRASQTGCSKRRLAKGLAACGPPQEQQQAGRAPARRDAVWARLPSPGHMLPTLSCTYLLAVLAVALLAGDALQALPGRNGVSDTQARHQRILHGGYSQLAALRACGGSSGRGGEQAAAVCGPGYGWEELRWGVGEAGAAASRRPPDPET